MNRLSRRLSHIADMVSKTPVLADVGTDHGYLPIALLQRKKIERAIAMDINAGPLARANEHIAREQLGEYIQTRCSDGLAGLGAGEANTVVIAGMGGQLTINILKRKAEIVRMLDELILEPQSDIHLVRAYLREQNYLIEAEDFVLEDGKYYPILRVLPRKADASRRQADELKLPMEVLDAYGPCLLRDRHPVLVSFLEKEKKQNDVVEKNLMLAQNQNERISERLKEIREKKRRNEMALKYLNA
ncbi:MAG: class I SAM-dependent methyltransferase [bacterium]|nr:class I SAM-dependent methyltransferase [bacterium]